MLTICSYFFQTMAHKYDGDSDYELFEEFEDLPSEHESDISSDEHGDQGDDDDYAHYSDYIDIEEEPLHTRASRNVQSRTVGSASGDPQPESSTDAQAGASTDAQVDPSDDQHNVALIGGDIQFEDASSSPEKQPAQRSGGFSLRSLRQGATKRSYQ